MKNTVILSKDIRDAVELFAEFGSRNEYRRNGKIIVKNDVTDPKGEGIFLSRIARIVYSKTGDIGHAYDFAMKAFTDGAYNRLQKRNLLKA